MMEIHEFEGWPGRVSSAEKQRRKLSLVQQYWVPHYLDEENFSYYEYLKEWSKCILEKNDYHMTETKDFKGTRFHFYKRCIVESIFLICEDLKQPPEVRYLALDILDRFLILHFFNVWERTKKMERTSSEWSDISSRMCRQSFLRMLSAVQLAAKYSSDSKGLSAPALFKYMKSKNVLQCTKKVILDSEIRVYTELKFQIPSVTPLTYLEMHFENLWCLRDVLQIKSLHHFFEFCISIMDVCMACHTNIYDELWVFARRNMDKDEFLLVKGDLLYLSSGVLLIGAKLQDLQEVPGTFLDDILEYLHQYTEYEKSRIELLSEVIFNVIKKNA